MALRLLTRCLQFFVLWCLSACAKPYMTSTIDNESQAANAMAAPVAGGSRAWTKTVQLDDDTWAFTDPGELPTIKDTTGAELPLEHTAVRADLRGHVAEVEVTQTFRNTAKDVIEVQYAFPLPENSAVSSMRMVIGDRVVESDVMERKAARETYDGAKAAGHTAALLEQERPNIFTQSVANIAPGEDIDVVIRYVQVLSYDAGQYEFVFPMVVGPRYTGGRVADAQRINPPIVGHGMRRGDDFTIEVTAQTGHPIEKYIVPTHDVVANHSGNELSVRLQKADERPNRDFVLRYGAAGAKPRATMFLGPPDAKGSGHFALVVQPPDIDVDDVVGRREFFFVVDRSGSMYGEKLGLAKEAVREALGRMRPVDTFEVVSFASGTQRLFGTPRPANADNLATALQFIDGLRAGGGTEMGNAVNAALSNDVAEGRHRYVMFLTDGFVGFEDEIIAGAERLVEAIAARGQQARVFGVGIGAASNRHLIDGVSKAGQAVPLSLVTRADRPRAVNQFMRLVDHAVVEDLKLASGSLKLTEQHPNELRDLFASHVEVTLGRYEGKPTKPPVLRGNVDGKQVAIDVAVLPTNEKTDVLDTLWARAAVADLEAQMWNRPSQETVEAITEIGLEHHIVTAYTSFVAVDRSRVVGNGDPRTVVEPTILPEDMSHTAVGRTIAMEEFRNIPVGNSTSRDYTAVVESSASASRDVSLESAPLRLSGAAELKMDVEEPSARVRIRKVDAPSGVARGPFRRAFRVMRDATRQCFRSSQSFADDRQYTLDIVLRWDERGRLQIDVETGLDLRECVEKAAKHAPWPGEKAGTEVRLSINLAAR